MKFIKKHWYLVLVTLFTLGLGVVVYVTSQRLATTKQVAPTAAQTKPKAAASACVLAFAINLNASPTPTPTPASTNTPTPTPASTNTPTPTPKQITYLNPTATPPPPPSPVSCNNTCTVNTDCSSGLVCVDGSCRNASCTADTTCLCAAAPPAGVTTPGPTPKTPVSGGPTVLGASVIGIGALILILGLAL